MNESAQVELKKVKLNTKNIHSILVNRNKNKQRISASIKRDEEREDQRKKLEKKEKQLESPVVNSLDNIKNSVRPSDNQGGGNIFNKLFEFLGLMLAGIIVNALPAIIEKVREIVDALTNFFTPVQSAFKLIIGFFTGQDIGSSAYDADRKRVSDSFTKLNRKGGLADKMLFAINPIVGLTSKLLNVLNKGENRKGVVLAKQNEKEGFLNVGTGKFTVKQWTSAEREEYESSGGSTGEPGSGYSGDPGNIAVSGNVIDKGVEISKKIMSDTGATKQAAAAIAGNMAHESAGFIPGIREGGPFGRSSKPWPRGTVRRGYGWAQWTNSRPGDRYDQFIQSYGGDYNKIPSNADNYRFLMQELLQGNGGFIRKGAGTSGSFSEFKKKTDLRNATIDFRKTWERAGIAHDTSRINYARKFLARLGESTNGQGGSENSFHIEGEKVSMAMVSPIEKMGRTQLNTISQPMYEDLDDQEELANIYIQELNTVKTNYMYVPLPRNRVELTRVTSQPKLPEIWSA